ncbi:MAG: nucleotidyl transferase AbiEii/AbiGii toxin family protein [Candidatus Omnitrophica bacterium]|nr:nucleotidyl transferase AbiEii/AbiGii toxin family protein [Candidatus Omnitrophota bacterium]MBU1350075.1 nucleotidyl transferase AbiEii/AbiGii toxin family protein [Patescibacteria group bacterium]MBU0896400.1 nucleotidyl transferase AbiEii/AbiGii toxin family protein [Candidatus Omnitrophota bacterium]MBU1134476.1 nucleotidyl transferase AbiEii/AbiGii toxin family protein [Candidatus Omnitrophota bacterium]MBU1523569.1 nucleotidyl transferase AbiEii/AbiGii toxin family protein [Candidatus
MLELRQIESFFPQQLRHFKRNLLREYLQYKILEAVFANRYGQKLVFMGGTAIHIVHGLPRFSEDLDFDNQGLTKGDFSALTQGVAKKLALEGYVVKTETSFKGAFSADIKVMRVLFDEGFSGHQDEKILIKLDAESQNFEYSAERVVINKFDVFTGISVVPIDILLAQKFYAILARKRAMGRDFYDAIFLAGKTKSDFAYLKERAGIIDKEMLKSALLKRCAKLDFKLLSRDVEQFVFSPEEAKKVLLFIEYVRGW